MATRETRRPHTQPPRIARRPRRPVETVEPVDPAYEDVALRDPAVTDPTYPSAGGTPPPARGDWRESVITASSLNVLAGIWLIIAPFVIGYGNGNPYWNDILFGAIVLILGATRAAGAYRASALSWLNCLVGIWIFASAFWLDRGGAASANDIVLGIVVFVLGAISATASDEANAAAATRRWYRR